LERKLEKQSELKQQNHEFIQEYVQLNHMTEIPINEIGNDKPTSPGGRDYTYYIPYHAVIKKDSKTIKLSGLQCVMQNYFWPFTQRFLQNKTKLTRRFIRYHYAHASTQITH